MSPAGLGGLSGAALARALYGPSQDAQQLTGGFQGQPNSTEEVCWLLRQLMLELKSGIQRAFPVILTIVNTAQDYSIAGPAGARAASVFIHNPNSSAPTNNIIGYCSAGLGWFEGGTTDSSGLAYNAKNSGYNGGYVGAAMRPDEVVYFDLAEGGAIHVASATANAVAVVSFFA